MTENGKATRKSVHEFSVGAALNNNLDDWADESVDE